MNHLIAKRPRIRSLSFNRRSSIVKLVHVLFHASDLLSYAMTRLSGPRKFRSCFTGDFASRYPKFLTFDCQRFLKSGKDTTLPRASADNRRFVCGTLRFQELCQVFRLAGGCPTPEERASNKEALQVVLISARTLADVPALNF